MTEKEPLSPLQLIRKQRADRQEALLKAEEAQVVVDLTALDAFETELGDSNVAFLKVPFSPGLPVHMIARKPTKPELLRYRAQVKERPRNGKAPEAEKTPTEACEIVADACRIYPADDETYERLCAERPGARAQLGQLALKLIVDQETDDAKK